VVELDIPAVREGTYPPPPEGEPFWPVWATLVGAIVLQFTLPERLTVGPSWLVPALEGALLLGLVFSSPRELEHRHARRRWASMGLVAFVSAANIYSLVSLSKFLLHHHPSNGRELIFSGILIWVTNFLIFCLWYWLLDRGGPGQRVEGEDGPPDFLFPQMTDDARSFAPRGWEPTLGDYLYVSFTNATAFSPTDTLPLKPWAKLMMLFQSALSLVVGIVIIAYSINVLT
jgi:uncharacterized membrane protein